ncbi:MAG: hypothetical protein OJF61_002978 [Rhodanobacteraceae bacterium]|jgi:tetratricopeptide (TPR) repeat protein|nr:MAG: hypothetical protein OJF61_002978 [Rhodanobacteraceae bacterium]
MGLNDRLFAPPVQDASKVEARLAKLPPGLHATIQRAGDALAGGDLLAAQNLLRGAMAVAAAQPDVLRMHALLLAQQGNLPASIAAMRAALRAAPDDAVTYSQYAQICEAGGDLDAALQLRQSAVEHLPESPLAWADLGEHLYQYRGIEAAIPALERATRLAPDYAPAQLKYGSALVAVGRAAEGAASIRQALAIEPAFGAAWLALADIKTVSMTADEMTRMGGLLRGDAVDESERTAIGFALGRALEEAGSYAEAFDLLVDANARRKAELQPWPAELFRAEVSRAEQVFDMSTPTGECSGPGEEIIFVVGMPRSGTTLVEQILASHHDVQAAGELGDLARVLSEESARLQMRYPEWVPRATASDWRRLGERYLELTSRWRASRKFSTDKMPNNWRAIGAIRAMLPGARIVVCRRDPLENCWSCFKQYFPHGWEFTYDMDELAQFWRAFDTVASRWAKHSPAHVREQSYEELTSNHEQEIRALLGFCGLSFDDACLRFDKVQRSVETLSAAQVRQPMQRHKRTAANYGALLDPLRRALHMPASAATAGKVPA